MFYKIIDFVILIIIYLLYILCRYERLMPQFEGDNLEIRIDPLLEEDEKIHVLVTHDETIFHANDGRKSGWAPKNEQPLRKKGQGSSIHVSDFLCETSGRLCLHNEQNSSRNETNIEHEARVIIHPGKNRDGYWNIEQLIKQVSTNTINVFV